MKKPEGPLRPFYVLWASKESDTRVVGATEDKAVATRVLTRMKALGHTAGADPIPDLKGRMP